MTILLLFIKFHKIVYDYLHSIYNIGYLYLKKKSFEIGIQILFERVIDGIVL